MDSQDKTKSELIKDSQKLQQEYDSLKTSYSKTITERNLAKETIRVLARFPSENPDPVLRVDQNGKLLYANEVSFKLLTWKLEIGVKIPPFLQKIICEVLKEGIGKIIETEHYQQVFSFNIVPIVEEGYVNLYGKNITKRNQAIKELALHNTDLLILNRFALELSNLSSEDNLEALIIKQIKEIACAKVAIFAEYNSANRTTTTKHILMESGLLEKVIRLLGKKIQDIHSVVSDEDYQVITTEMIGIRKTLYEASFGAIPRSVGAAIQAFLKVDRIIGVAYMIEGKLYGTSILLMAKGHPDPPKEILENFIHLAASSLRRNQAEKALKENEERFRTLFENSTIGIYRTTPDGKILLANPTLVKLLGYSSFEELSGRNLEKKGFEPSYERTHFMDILKRNGEVKGLESAWTRMDGTTLFISESARAINDKEGKNIYYDGIVEDITLRKKAEQELIIANKDLVFQNKEKEKRAVELIKAKEHAEESDRLKSAFLTNMSHEIRTPMNGIIGFTELLKEPNLSSDEQQDYIQTIQISGARMLNTINNIVDVSKIESGLTKVDIKETNINEKIEFTYKFFKPEVENKGLKFSFKTSLPSKEAIIKTDNEKVYGILTNLVRNAIKFTFDGSIEFGYEKKGEYLEFYVKDTGVGIPKIQYQMIFERFRQGSESHNRGYEGSGLGLSIAKSYVEMLGGEIWVESKEGLGSTFYFTIPYNAVSEERTEIENVVSEKDKEVEIKKLKILIVEDDEISHALLTRMLQKISYEVLHTITGVEAIEACRNNPDIDLVLMDIRMPVMDGNEATRQIRQFNKDVIIIAQTAYGFSGDKEKAIEAGCKDYISKPINKTLLYELIKKHFNH
jgi:PAS domain S-box-containing protein